MKRLLAAAVAVMLPALALAIDVDPRYGRESLGYLPPTVAKVLASASSDPWERRVAQDMSVWLGAQKRYLRLMAWSRFRPGYNCLTARIGKKQADEWVSFILKVELKEQSDVDHWDAVNKETENWPAGPAEDCRKPPTLFNP